MMCKTCSGMRFVLVERPKYWKQCGVKAVIGTQMLSEICHDCQGTGVGLDPAHDPDCTQCQGTGVRNAWAAGEWETEECQCTAPVEALEVA